MLLLEPLMCGNWSVNSNDKEISYSFPFSLKHCSTAGILDSECTESTDWHLLQLKNKSALSLDREKMEDLFARASLSYLTSRCDEGFESLYCYLVERRGNEQIQLTEEEQEVFCLVSMSIIEKRYQSWVHLNRFLTQSEAIEQRQAIEVYLDVIANELNVLSEKILQVIERCSIGASLSLPCRVSFLKMQGDVHFLVCQTSHAAEKVQHFLSTLKFYNEALELCEPRLDSFLLQITYNKALVKTSHWASIASTERSLL